MNLLNLPEEVIEGYIPPFAFLEWNDLLRFRKVCKSLHGFVQAYLKVHPALAPELEINEEGRSFDQFMKLGIPTTKLFLNNTLDYGHGLYFKQWNDAKEFLQHYGPLIKSLRVKQVSLYICGKELEFLEALVNLKEFTAGHYALGKNMGKAVFDNLKRANRHLPMSMKYPIPQSFGGLKAFKIGSGMGFYLFLSACLKTNVKLKNVASIWFPRPHNPNAPDFPELGTVVLSLVNLHPAVFQLNMPNLERIEIRQTSRRYMGSQWRQLGGRPEWPALQSLEVNVDSAKPDEPVDARIFAMPEYPNLLVGTKTLLQFLFQGASHLALTVLKLSFEKEDGSLPTPKMEEVVASCPSLKKLTLVKWPGTNKALVNLWSGLPGLEEVSLEYCRNLGNVTFVGEDRENPVFFKLKNLKKLTLKGLDQMPKITDLLFSLVIRHLSLTHFILTSDGPVESITPVGIESLLCGRFAETIEKFPFQDWSLSKLTSEDWKKLEKKFRSYEML